MDISIVIVSWNVKEKLQNNLKALLASRGVKQEIFVVDNASTDSSAEMVKNDFPDVKLIVNRENFGFAKACNQGIKQSTGRYILLLNPDMEVFPWTLERILDWLDNNPQAAITGIQLVDKNGQTIPQVRRLPGLFDQSLVASKLGHTLPFLLRSYLCKNFDYSKEAKVDSIRGSFFVIRRSTIETLGLLDERYFIWFEEVDYCRAARKHNLEVYYTPVAQAVDYVGQSFKQVDHKTTQQYFKTSMLAYFKKWQPAWQSFVLKLAWSLGALVMKILKKA